jgi:hypothetical protein
MFTPDTNRRLSLPSAYSPPLLRELADQLHQYFARHPEVSPTEFMVSAVRREIKFRTERREREQARPDGKEARQIPPYHPVSDAEEIQAHSWLNERLASLQPPPRLWERVWRQLFGTRPAR